MYMCIYVYVYIYIYMYGIMQHECNMSEALHLARCVHVSKQPNPDNKTSRHLARRL